MITLRNIFMLLLIACPVLAVHAQTADDDYQAAEKAYEFGHFAQVDSLLTSNVKRLKGVNRINAYRLLALSALYQDHTDMAEAYVTKLLALDPFYTAYNDSPRFSDLLERLKKGKTTITTASQQEETLEEVPVPTTLITEDMIRASGVQTLSELLLLFVPGMSRVAGGEDNVAMRGVYGMGQEMILVLEDGHRLNSQSTNTQPMDYRINLDKVKQVEVLRGPASSLYGNVALTAVVNVITKSGGDFDGNMAAGLTDKNNTFGLSYLNGRGNLRTDYLAWISMYNSKGERYMDGQYPRYIGGFNSNPAFDLGLKIRWDDFSLRVAGRHAKPVPFYNIIDAGGYSYDKYGKQNGEAPGQSHTHIRFDIDYSHKWDAFSVSASVFGNLENTQIYNVVGDSIDPRVASTLVQYAGVETGASDARTVGLWESIEMKTYTFGGSISGAYKYAMPRYGMDGSLLVGIQYECLVPAYANFKLGSDYNTTRVFSSGQFHDGAEHSISCFVQLKHHLTKRLIFNGGVRSDHRTRYDNDHINTFAPRVSFIWLTNDVLNLKAGYSHSFVDAPYVYRACKIPLFSGPYLEPEKMDAYNISANFDWPSINMKYEATAFYNHASDLVYYNLRSSEATFMNSGTIEVAGVEQMIQYAAPRTLISLNTTYQYPLRIENYLGAGSHNAVNVPHLVANLTAAQQVVDSKRLGKVWLRANLHAQSSCDLFAMRTEEIIIAMLEEENASPTVFYLHQPSVAILGAGVEWALPFGLAAAIDAHNLFNTRYKVGGLSREGVPQQGFNLIGKLRFKF